MRRTVLTIVTFVALATQLSAQQLTPQERARIDSAALAVLTGSGAPSASVAIVRGGEIVYEQAYGTGRIDPTVSAAPAMRYAIGSVSKQFTAAALLLLEQDGKLSLDDRVAKWFPRLTRANDITLRHLLSMTSGYQDYWPQDYVFMDMHRPATAEQIVERWAAKQLDFEPGAMWQYSNTNYVIAGRVVELVSGQPFMAFLRTRIFTPLGMTSVADFDAGSLSSSDAGAYLRNGLGPLRVAPKEGKGWLFGAGQLAMTAHDLALWNLAMINRTALSSASYAKQQTTNLLNAGTTTGYGLGVNVGTSDGRRRITHGGAVSGYTTTNIVYPDDRAAIVVFTNIYPGAAGATGQIAGRIANIILQRSDPEAAQARELARRIYDGLVKGKIERTLFTDNANAYFTDEVLADYAASLAPLGEPTEFSGGGGQLRGGMRIRGYSIRAGGVTMDLTMMIMPDGTVEQYIVARGS